MVGNPRPSEQQVAVARVYARAALSLAAEANEARELLAELEGLLAYLDGRPEVERFLSSPLVERDVRRQALERVLRGRASDLLVDTLQVMNRKGRAGLLRALAVAYRQELEELEGIVRVRVRSAVALSDGARRRLQDAVTRMTGRRPRLEEEVDDSLIGGLVVGVGDRKIDASVASVLKGLASQLVERAAHEARRAGSYVTE